MDIIDKILLESNNLPNKQFSFDDLNGRTVTAIIGNSNKSDSVIVGYELDGNRQHQENYNDPDVKNLFYILGRVCKFVQNYIKQYNPKSIIIQSDYEKHDIGEKRIKIYKNLIDKNISHFNYSSTSGKNQHGYYIQLNRVENK